MKPAREPSRNAAALVMVAKSITAPRSPSKM
jgi:hypothetical protein